MKKIKYILPVSVTVAILAVGCGGEEVKQKESQKDKIAKEMKMDQGNDRLNSAQKVFIQLPSPFEVASLLKTSGAIYNQDILNDIEHISNYTTSKSQAMNLGVYGADFSIASIFGQTQQTIYYLGAIKRLTENLGIASAFDPTTMQRFESNQDNQDSLKKIVNDAYLMANSYLKDNDRSGLSSLILAGGWIEGLYIATNLYDPANPNDDLKRMIAEQKYSLSDLVTLLESSKDDSNVADVLPQFQKLNDLFMGVEESASAGEAVEQKTDEAKGMTMIGGDDDLEVTAEKLAAITEEVRKIRNSIVK